MSTTNPYITDLGRAPYELAHLMRTLPVSMPVGHVMTNEERQKAQAAIAHASNANYALMAGMEAIGNILFAAVTNENFPPKEETLSSIAALITHMAVEAQVMQETQSDLQSNLDVDAERAARAQPHKKAAK